VKLQRFVGKNTKSVLDEIRTTLGDEALIVSNTKVGSKTEIIAACDSSAEVRPDFNETQTGNEHRDEGNSSRVTHSEETIQSRTDGLDPWAHIKNINEEIRAIKSSLDQLPSLNPNMSSEPISKLQSKYDVDAEANSHRKLNTETSHGCHIVWGDRESGKTSVIKQLLKMRKINHGETSIFSLPHEYRTSDSHLADVAAKNSVNLLYINNFESTKSVIDILGEDSLIFIEADLSLLPQIAAQKGASWLQTSSSYLISEDQKQNELIAKLFLELNAPAPMTLSSERAENIIYRMPEISNI
jgi:flagellar biosynthesis GTPase FlhF